MESPSTQSPLLEEGLDIVDLFLPPMDTIPSTEIADEQVQLKKMLDIFDDVR